MNLKQKKAAIAVARQQLEAAKAVVALFEASFTDFEKPEPVQDAWNAAHDMVRALEGAEHQIEQDYLFQKIVASGQYESYKLAAQNID